MKMLKEIRPVYIVMLLFSVATALYYPSILEIFFHPNVFNIDDVNLMDFILNHDLQFKEVFSPGGSGKYFRPFSELSFLIDQRLWGADAFGFRLTNLLIHAFNITLVYLTVRLIFKNNPRSEEIAILSAIIFGVHPIAVESVAWICGRTDPLATMWGLLAFWLYLSARLKNRWYLLPFSLFCILASALSKEVGVAIPIIIAVWETAYSRIYWNVTMGKKKIIFIVSTAIIPAYILLRLIFLDAKDMSLGLIKSGISSDITSSTLAFLASFGFYIKKFIYPFPLELVIEDINIPIYAFFGFAVIMFLVISICINSLRKYSFFLLWALLGIGPAALISFTDIAWTRWAERYLYFSLVPLSVMTSMAYFEVTDRLSYEKKRVASVVGIGLLVSLALATYHRSRLWNDNLSFWTDAYNKSPDSINVSVTYSRSLIESKMETEAEKVLYKALDLNGPKHQVVYDLANISRSRGDFEKAEEYYNEALSEAKSDKRFILEGARFKSRILLSMGELKIGQAVKIDDNEQKKVLHLKGIDFMDQAYRESPDAFLLYRIAKEYLGIGEKEKAVIYFKQYMNVSGDNIYRQAAEKLIRKLE